MENTVQSKLSENVNQIYLRKFLDSDIELMIRWLNQSYVIKWYIDADAWIEELSLRDSQYEWIHHFIVMKGNQSIGFCQYYDCYDAKSLEDWYNVDQRGTFSIDYLIGEKDCLRQGFGRKVVKLLIDVIATHENGKQIIVQPDEENIASKHVLLANDFHYDKQKDYYFKQI